MVSDRCAEAICIKNSTDVAYSEPGAGGLDIA
ncbi:hypothetical protein BN439_3701 [Erwinia amylovora Ea644]|nr:hypothetical protein BN439_3701 [Erwinia amylovora Ea644]CCP08790.1 hypothetical protein BN440_3804 [Erwinia amylovora MR1]